MACWFVEHVLAELFAFVLHRVEQQAVQLFVDRQHRLAAHAGPAAEGHDDLVLPDQLLGLLGEQGPVRGRVDNNRLELLAEQAALGVDLVDGHEHGVFEHRLGDGHRARQRMKHADLDGVGRLHEGREPERGDAEGDGGEGLAGVAAGWIHG